MEVNSFKLWAGITLWGLPSRVPFIHKVIQRTNAKEAERSAEKTLCSQLLHNGVG